MNCPFLRETWVKFCQAAPVRKLIPLAQCGRADEKCSSGAHTGCRVFLDHPVETPGQGDSSSAPCPHLGESLMQYCNGSAVTRLVPYSESVLSRCGNEGYRYCELYLAMAHPMHSEDKSDRIPLADWLHYSANHMWLDLAEDGSCHVGIDAFFSRALGPVEHISYVWNKGEHRPAAILTAAGNDYEVVFPNALQITGCNLYLRANPARLSSDPYTAGWLFEGTQSSDTLRGLLHGADASTWAEQEERHMSQFLQDQMGRFSADGGLFVPRLLAQLPREQALATFHEFFSPWGGADERSRRGKREE
jgi:glycine cleavage system H lipoate-binding protein